MKNIYKPRLLFLVLLWLLPFVASAQLVQGKRIELELNSSMEEDHKLFSLGNEGVLLCHSAEDFYKRKMTINFSRYGSTLNELWKSSFVAEEEFALTKTFQNERLLFVLFKKREKTNIGVLRLDLE